MANRRLCVLSIVFMTTWVVVPADVYTDWESFAAQYGYNVTNDTSYDAFVENYNYIQSFSQSGFQVGLNEYANLNSTGYTVLLGWSSSSSSGTPNGTFSSTISPSTSKNWVTGSSCVNPVRNQGSCGSCWAFAATGAMEGQLCKWCGGGIGIVLSPQNLVDCDLNSNGCSGGRMENAYTYIEENVGIDTEASYPYVHSASACNYKPYGFGAMCSGYKIACNQGDEATLMQAVDQVGPISIAIDASLKSFHLYKSGIYQDPACSSTNLNHAVLLVGYGYDNTLSQDYWLIKNSWGTSWGESGYLRLLRNGANLCGITNQATYPLIDCCNCSATNSTLNPLQGWCSRYCDCNVLVGTDGLIKQCQTTPNAVCTYDNVPCDQQHPSS